MSRLVDRACGRLLRLAVRRWPAALRDEQAREWAAELDALRREPGGRPYTRLRYAASLAASRPVEDPWGTPPAWTAALPGIRSAFGPLAVLLAAPFAGTSALIAVLGLFSRVINRVPGPLDDNGIVLFTATSDAGRIVLTLGATAVAGVLGWALGSRVPPVRTALAALGIPVLVGLGAYLALALQYAGEGPALPSAGPYGIGCWTVLLALVSYGTLRLAPRGRRRRAVLAAGLGGLGGLALLGLAYPRSWWTVLGPALVVYALARQRPRVLPWAGLMLGAAVFGVPLILLTGLPAEPLGTALRAAAGYPPQPDAVPYLPGAVLLAIALAPLVSGRLAHQPIRYPPDPRYAASTGAPVPRPGGEEA